MLFFLRCTESGEFEITPTPEVKKGEIEFEVLVPGLPLGTIQNSLQGNNRGHRISKGEVLKSLKKLPGFMAQNYRWERLSTKEPFKGQREDCFSDFLLRTQGRQLSEVDLQRLSQEMGLNLKDILELCESQIRRGQAEWITAVSREGKGWRCRRCGEVRVEEWPSIYGVAATCPACASLGALSSLQVLYRSLSKPNISINYNTPISFSPRWELSPAQKQASEEIMDFVSSANGQNAKINQEILLWAACGAGKTEVCFPAAAWALEQGKRVLFAAPRQDVVLDVAPRIKRDFPGLALSILTGTSPQRFTPGQFVLATTHQVLRFYQAFDVIFLDEMDAFPYDGNSALIWGLQRALKPFGKVIYLTATPSLESLEKVKRGESLIVRLPARHHRNALPVPEWEKFPWEFEKEKLRVKGPFIQALAHWIKELAASGPVLVFVPKISWVNKVVEALREEFPHWKLAGSYSADSERREKIEGLKSKGYRVFISTSILERGVTVADAQVIVLSADHEIFDERALVQMAGRVGRMRENPQGRAIFLAKKKTEGIKKAIQWIEEQNRLALEQGLIDA